MHRCLTCGFEAVPGISSCPLCGAEITARGARKKPDGPAWEDPELAFPGNVRVTWRESLFRPAEFFARLGDEMPFSRPLLYYLLMAVASAFFTLWWRAVGVSPEEFVPLLGEVGDGAPLADFFLSPFVALAALAIWTVVVHLLVLLLAPQRSRLSMTARVFCYASGTWVLAAMPIVGSLAGLIWGTVIQIVGLREVHRMTTWRASLAVVWLPALLLAFIGALLTIVVIAMGLTTLTGMLGGFAEPLT